MTHLIMSETLADLALERRRFLQRKNLEVACDDAELEELRRLNEAAARTKLWHVYEPVAPGRWREHVHRYGREKTECGVSVIGPDVVHADGLPDSTPDEAIEICTTCVEVPL